MRDGSSAFAMSANVIGRREPPLRLTKRDWTRWILPGRTGTGRSSPSEVSPETAVTLKAYVPTLRGAVSANVTSAPPPASAENGAEVPAAGSPNSDEAPALVAASRISIVTRPDILEADALLTTTFSCAPSDSRRNRGTYGRTMRSLKLFASFSREPAFRSRVTAWTQTFHEVTESGTVNSIAALPAGSASKCGIQIAVSAKLDRNSPVGAAGGTGAGEAAASALLATPPAASRACADAIGASAVTATPSFSITAPPGPRRRPGPPMP